MSALESARDHQLALHRELRARLGDEPGWLAALRREALERFAEAGFPSTKVEEWRHTNVAPIARAELPLAGPPPRVTRGTLEELCAPAFACSLFAFVDGRFAPELSAGPALAGGARVESLARLLAEEPERVEPHLGQRVDLKRHPFAALGTAFLEDGAVLQLPDGHRDERPLHLVFLSTGAHVTHPRVLVTAGRESRARVIQDHVSLPGAAGFCNAVCELSAEAGAELDWVLLQREGDEALHVSQLAARLERDARLRTHALVLGGRLVRNDLGVLLAGEGAEAILDGLFVAGDEAVVDNHTWVDHAVPHCTSRELYKGILGGSARGVFRGRVIVRPDAQRTDATQSNPNLLLSEGAEIDTQPQLEIYADDVKCSHGSSIGRLDAEALFFLRSRGIGEADARALLIRAFAAQILERIPVEALSRALDERLAPRLRVASGGAS